jgi:hypothetical protein
MRGIATWLVLAAVGLVVIAGVTDALRGSSSHAQSAPATEATIGGLTTTAPSVQATTEPVATTQAVAATEAVATTAPDIPSDSPERLPSCATGQLRLTFTVADGLAALKFRRVAGEPCHHGRSPIGFTARDESGHKLPLFPASAELRKTVPADFTDGFVQLMQIPYSEVCDPAGSFLAVATVGPYVARRTVPGKNLVCNHG